MSYVGLLASDGLTIHNRLDFGDFQDLLEIDWPEVAHSQ